LLREENVFQVDVHAVEPGFIRDFDYILVLKIKLFTNNGSLMLQEMTMKKKLRLWVIIARAEQEREL